MSDQTRAYYESIGWKAEGNTLVDLQRWEDLRESSRVYNDLGEQRVFEHIPASGRAFLDIGCGPLLHDQMLNKTSGYEEYHCVDFSPDALQEATRKLTALGRRHTCRQGNFLDMELPRKSFDCVVSLSCLFHVHRDQQAPFVLKALDLAKPGVPVIITYANPNDFASLVPELQATRDSKLPVYPSYAYYHVHPMAWWDQFMSKAKIDFFPFRTLRSVDQAFCIPDGAVGSLMLAVLSLLEKQYPSLFLKYGHYYTAVLRGREEV